MIEVPVHNLQGQQVDSLQIDEQLLGGEVRPDLLKQAYVRLHANRRLGTVRTKNRTDVAYSTRKLYRQKGTGNARRGSRGANILRGGGHAHAKRPKSWRLKMPEKMRRLANRNALLAKLVDNEVKVIDTLNFDKPSTKQFDALLTSLKIDRTCLVALPHTHSSEARSARNIESVSVTRVGHLNVFEVLNHRYLVIEKDALMEWIGDGRSAPTGPAENGKHEKKQRVSKAKRGKNPKAKKSSAGGQGKASGPVSTAAEALEPDKGAEPAEPVTTAETEVVAPPEVVETPADEQAKDQEAK